MKKETKGCLFRDESGFTFHKPILADLDPDLISTFLGSFPPDCIPVPFIEGERMEAIVTVEIFPATSNKRSAEPPEEIEQDHFGQKVKYRMVEEPDVGSV